MKLQDKTGLLSLIALAGFVGFATNTFARPNISNSGTHRQVQLKATASCQPASAAIDLDINNIDARLMDGGDMWWNLGTQVAAYEIPKGSGKSSQFAASCWIGGYDAQGQLKVAAQTYRQDGNDYWPGILDANNTIDAGACLDWDRFWKLNKSDVLQFIDLAKAGQALQTQNNPQFQTIWEWPAVGNRFVKGSTGATLSLPLGRTYAPFVDVGGGPNGGPDGIYNPGDGDYPDIIGDQYIWWVFNDVGNVKQQSQTASIGLEVQTAAFAYSSNDYLNDATFYKYRVINRGNFTMDSTYIAVWDDCDLGYYYDDYIGCDTTRGLGIDYNGKSPDGSGQVNSYGTQIPQVGLDFFQGPIKVFHTAHGDSSGNLSMTNFTYYNNDFSIIGNPINGIEIYGYMTGTIRNGSHFSDDFQGPGTQCKGYGNGNKTNFVFSGDPGNHSEWSECSCGNPPGDRRMIFSAGPFVLVPGALNDIVFGCVWVPDVGACPNTSFTTIQAVDDQAQALFINNFKTIEGPNAPRLVCRPLDKKLVFYIFNDYGSNNYKEQFGTSDSLQYHTVSSKAAKTIHIADSLYKFQGYRIYQMANSGLTASDIYNSDGSVNSTNAAQVFECDIRDSITTIYNFTKQSSITEKTWVPLLKVTGRDSGIVHSFEITQDAFASGSNNSLVNYKSYYFIAIAYSFLDWRYDKSTHTTGFNPDSSGLTQDVAYLESTHGANSSTIAVVEGMPNPTNDNKGSLNSDYGTGIQITRIVGTGNGGNDLRLTQASEDSAVASLIVKNPVYQPGNAPINVKIVDPVLVPAMNWSLRISGNIRTNTPDSGIFAGSGTWTLIGTSPNGGPSDTITNERGIDELNEQILENYGLSISLQQVGRPGDNQTNGNGYITSDITYTDSTKPWLAGVIDAADSVPTNWLRSGGNLTGFNAGGCIPCCFNDNGLDLNSFYENCLSNNVATKSTWGPFGLVAPFSPHQASTTNNIYTADGSLCGFALSPIQSLQPSSLVDLPSVDVVFTPDMTKWTRCLVLEMQEVRALAENKAPKFGVRLHPSWLSKNGMPEFDASGNPVFESSPAYINGLPDSSSSTWGMSWFPGYAVNVETGERLNIVFGEDSWLKKENGADMLWNPTGTLLNPFDNSIVFGGKHPIYILSNRYDSDAFFRSKIIAKLQFQQAPGWNLLQWVGFPLWNNTTHIPYLPISKGLIPTQTKLRFRVTRPYAFFNPQRDVPYQIRKNPPDPANFETAPSPADSVALSKYNYGFPYYTFTTVGKSPTPISDNTDKSALLNRIQAVPNPYYGYSGYEQSRFDTKVRITNVPGLVTIYIYSLDGTLVRTLTKNDQNTPYLDWDIRNSAGLPVASGMYLMHVKVAGIGETTIKWFGAMRPIDITTY